MKKSIVFLLLLVCVLFYQCAFSSGTYGLKELREDAETIHNSLTGSSSASTAYERMYSFMFQDAREYILNNNSCVYHIPDKHCTDNIMHAVHVTCSKEMIEAFGYRPCNICHPDR